MAFFKTVETAFELGISSVGSLHHAYVEALIHPVVDIRVAVWVCWLWVLFWFSAQLNGSDIESIDLVNIGCLDIVLV